MKLKTLICAGAAWHAGQLAAGVSLPMEYYNADRPVETLGEKILVGVEPEITPDGEFETSESGVLYYVPKKAKATVTDVQTNIAANCSVIENDIAIEAEASAMYLDLIRELQGYREMLKDYDERLKEAIKACIDATSTGDPDAELICETKSRIAEIKTEIAEMIVPWEEVVNGIMIQTNARLEKYGKEPGGVANALVALYDVKDVQALEEANPWYSVQVVPIEGITFAFNPSLEDVSSVAMMPKKTTLGFSLAGDVFNPKAPGSSAPAVTQLKSGSQTALSITLSRLGACNKELLRSGVFSYDFPAYGYLKGSAEFNKWQVYTRLEENSSKGGLFSTKAVHKLYEDMKGERGFKFAAFTDGDTDLEEMKERLHARLLDQLLTDFAEVKQLANGVNPAGLPNPPQSGADAGADALLTCPHVYCQAAGYGLKTLDAIFGRKISRSEAKREMNVKVTEQFGYTHRYVVPESAAAMIKWDF